jgi:hypothetical protein
MGLVGFSVSRRGRAKAALIWGAFTLCFCAPAFGASLAQIRFLAGGGYTFVDLNQASGYDEDHLEDWNQGNYAFSLQGLYSLNPRLRLGLELGYEQLYYWHYRIPFGTTPVTREANWAMLFMGPVAQVFLVGGLYLQAGADLHFFEDSPAFGLSGAMGMETRIGSFSIPLELRVKPVFGDGLPTVLQVNTGFGLGF